ncbi:hypothetical protein DFJ58DRAFT_749267 [Suillus subalutaceus]|uniref:uncharacterized protein n=1 Tax=Suillus subalutaceus TaxID=48586 RepID=UPI001B882129|nr:uncharacterized protein DFJ58DRAFT_749267 [Suillus subalutaceus]KAG1838354.1 hypothetical protein DFJ58DRAFT_749267 [Suillus subalutaceus]
MLELSQRDDGCSLVDIDGVIYDVLNNATISVLGSATTAMLPELLLVSVRNVVNKARVDALTPRSKRHEEKCYSFDQIEVIVTSAYNKKNRSSTTSIPMTLRHLSAGTYTISQVATATKDVLDANGVVSKHSDNVDDLVEPILDELSARAAKRTDDINVPAIAENDV